MPLKTVAILSPGDMGHDVGRALGKHGLEVITCLQGRSDRTRGLSRQAGIRDAGSLEETVSAADLILSILVPGPSSGPRPGSCRGSRKDGLQHLLRRLQCCLAADSRGDPDAHHRRRRPVH